MDLLVVRHGVAEEREAWADRDDALRPLTADGKKKMKECARGLRSLLPRLDLLATSPLTRALQTAEILAKQYDSGKPVVVPALAPGERPETLAAWLREHASRDVVAIVGHEPHLSTAVSWLTAGAERPLLELRKGGACLLQLGARIERGQAMLSWLLRPSQLRALS